MSMHELRRFLILLLLLPLALLPRRGALLACRALGRFLMRRGSPYPGALLPLLPLKLASRYATSRRSALRRFETLTLYDRVLTLRAILAPRWRRRVELDGFVHVKRALAEGSGAILWVHPCISSNVAVKQAFAEAGYPLVHLTRPGHGFSSSALGVRVVGPILRRAENRYLDERVVIDGGNTIGPLRQLRRRLAENRLISITVGVSASRVTTVPFLDGGLRLPAGPIILAVSSGAPLLPVFTFGDPAHPRVCVGAPLPVRGNRTGDIEHCQRAAADWLAEQTLRHPADWAGWRQRQFQRD